MVGAGPSPERHNGVTNPYGYPRVNLEQTKLKKDLAKTRMKNKVTGPFPFYKKIDASSIAR